MDQVFFGNGIILPRENWPKIKEIINSKVENFECCDDVDDDDWIQDFLHDICQFFDGINCYISTHQVNEKPVLRDLYQLIPLNENSRHTDCAIIGHFTSIVIDNINQRNQDGRCKSDMMEIGNVVNCDLTKIESVLNLKSRYLIFRTES